jgi:hypothetical protein
VLAGVPAVEPAACDGAVDGDHHGDDDEHEKEPAHPVIVARQRRVAAT